VALETASNPTRLGIPSLAAAVRYLLAGTLFGVVAIKSEIVSWYRIQEMFRFQSFHMFGVILSAVLVAGVSLWLLRRLGARSLEGDEIAIPSEASGWRRYLFGGSLFGLGWAATGACPGPILALIGSGAGGFVVVLISAVLGTWAYAALRHRLPH
jgi:uncharacterized membrane protein YedE/YeeE